MKIAIVTICKYVQELNYGSALQAFALYQKIKSLGHDVEILDYMPRYKANEGDNFRRPYLTKRLPKCVRLWYALNLYEIERRWREFGRFFKTRVLFSKERYDHNNFNASKYDVIVVGSDTIWNIPQTRFDPAFYADYPSVRKAISYAASFGDSIYSEEEKTRFARLIEKFVAVSVRERYNMEAFPESVRNNVFVAVDPTLLLSRDAYEDILSPCKMPGKYLLYFQLYYKNKAVRLAVDAYARAHGLKVVEVSVSKENGLVWICKLIARCMSWSRFGKRLASFAPPESMSHEMRYGSSVEEWLGLVKGAELVVTNSFHGTVFSIIFGRPFFNYARPDASSKIRFVCDRLGLSDRILAPGVSLFDRPIDYAEVVYPRLEKWRKESESFLVNALLKAECD